MRIHISKPHMFYEDGLWWCFARVKRVTRLGVNECTVYGLIEGQGATPPVAYKDMEFNLRKEPGLHL